MKKAHLFLSCLALVLITSCGSSKKIAKVDPFIGAWSLLIEDTPQGDISATMTITKNEVNAYLGTLNSDLGLIKLSDLKIEDNKLSSTFFTQDIDFDLIGTFEETIFKGYVSGMGTDFKADGKKIVE